MESPTPNNHQTPPSTLSGPILHWMTTPEFARTIPYWLIAIVGLAYAGGFVVVELSLGSFGMRDVGADLWKARYIHIGFLGLIFPVLPVLTALIMYEGIRIRQEKIKKAGDESRPFLAFRVATGWVLYALPQVAFYIVIFLGRQGTPTDVHYLGFYPLSWMLLVLSCGSTLVY